MMIKKYIHKHMLKYINMAVFRDDFITGTLKAIENYSRKELISEDEYIEAVWNNIGFWFNKHESCELFAAEENEITEFVVSMSNRYYRDVVTN